MKSKAMLAALLLGPIACAAGAAVPGKDAGHVDPASPTHPIEPAKQPPQGQPAPAQAPAPPAARQEPPTFDIKEFQVDDRLPVHGGIEVNGMNTEHTTRTRLIASLRYDNLWQRFHGASLQFHISSENADEVQVWSGT